MLFCLSIFLNTSSSFTKFYDLSKPQLTSFIWKNVLTKVHVWICFFVEASFSKCVWFAIRIFCSNKTSLSKTCVWQTKIKIGLNWEKMEQIQRWFKLSGQNAQNVKLKTLFFQIGLKKEINQTCLKFSQNLYGVFFFWISETIFYPKKRLFLAFFVKWKLRLYWQNYFNVRFL